MQEREVGRLRDWIDRAAQHHPDKLCIVSAENGRAITYGELRSLTGRIAAYLRGRGLGPNDRVALIADNSIEHLGCYLGVMAYGATICTVHVEMNRHHLERILGALKPRLVVFEEELNLEPILGVTSAPRLPLGTWKGEQGSGFYAAVAKCDASSEGVHAGGKDDAVILFTSGTTELSNAEATADAFGISGADRIYDFRSYNWCSAQTLSALAPLARGATLIVGRKFSRSRFFDHIKEYDATIAAGNPTTIGMLLDADAPTRSADVPTLRFVISSSAPLPLEQWERFERQFGIRISQGYGCSEIGWIAARPGEERRLGTVGTPLPYHRLRIVDAEGRALPCGEIGSVELGGFEDNDYRYLADDGTITISSRGRAKTGDQGFLDTEGFLHLTGREKEVIIRGGVNISPLEIEKVLMQRPEIIEAATVGVPDRLYGEEVVSYVVARPGAFVDPDEILRYCASRLPTFKAPKHVFLSKDLPRSERGKLDRKALVERWKLQSAGQSADREPNRLDALPPRDAADRISG
jgi:acyl-coenzyme A synthetase/AMP-(fatty) acid ligase